MCETGGANEREALCTVLTRDVALLVCYGVRCCSCCMGFVLLLLCAIRCCALRINECFLYDMFAFVALAVWRCVRMAL